MRAPRARWQGASVDRSISAIAGAFSGVNAKSALVAAARSTNSELLILGQLFCGQLLLGSEARAASLRTRARRALQPGAACDQHLGSELDEQNCVKIGAAPAPAQIIQEEQLSLSRGSLSGCQGIWLPASRTPRVCAIVEGTREG